MDSNDYVRGKKRQRKRTPKTKTGCITCKRIKCDEAKPVCLKCSSTGRTCDGYIDDSTDRSSPDSATESQTSEKGVHIIGGTDPTEAPLTVHVDDVSNEPSNAISYPLLTFGFPSNPLPGRAFHYFVHRSSVDLTGPLHTQLWQEYVLNVCSTSPAIKKAVLALSGFHERYTIPDTTTLEEQCWRQYYLAVKGVNDLVRSIRKGEENIAVKKEVLVACAIFITIEILLGNIEAAIRHLEGGLALIEQYLTKGLYWKPGNPIAPRLDDHTADLLGWYARIDLQILSFLPGRHPSMSKPSNLSDPPPYAILQLCRNLPNAPSATLYRLIKHALYWIKHAASSFKYSQDVPNDVLAARGKLLVALKEWYSEFHTTSSHLNKSNLEDAETANLLVAYHLILLKVTTSLSPHETAFDTPVCNVAFREIIKNCGLILLKRNPGSAPFIPSPYSSQKQFYFSLETSTVEPLYYTALKCREPSTRRSAIQLLYCAGREGVWDGLVMARVAENIVSVELGNALPPQISFLAGGCEREEYLRGEFWSPCGQASGLDMLLGRKGCEGQTQGSERTSVEEEKRVSTVTFDVNEYDRNAYLECGWYSEKDGWRYENTVLTW